MPTRPPDIPLPSEGDLHDREIVLARRDDYDQRAQDFEFLRAALTGSGGFAPYTAAFDASDGSDGNTLAGSTYLRRYPRENAEKWQRRVKNAYYPNYIDWLVRIWIGLLTRETPARDSYPDQVIEWLDAASEDGKSSLDMLISDVYAYWWMAYGEMYAIVQGPTVAGDVYSAAQVDGGVYLTPVHPDRVMLAPEVGGQLAFFKYSADLPNSADPMSPNNPKGQRIYVLTARGVWWYDVEDGRTAAQIPVAGVIPWEGQVAQAGLVPVARLQRSAEQPSQIFHIAQAMLRLFNVLSMLGEIEDLSCFPVLAWPCRSPEEFKSLDWGSSTAMPYPAEYNATPQFIGYDSAPLEHLVSRAQSLIDEIKALSSLTQDQSTGASGLAKAFAFLQTDRTIMSMVSPLERFDVEVCHLAALWLGLDGLPDEARPGYPRSFDVQEIAEAMDGAQKLLDMQLEPHQQMLTKRAAFFKYHQALGSGDVKLVDEEFASMEQSLADEGADQQDPPEPTSSPSSPSSFAPKPPDLEAEPR